MLVIEGGALLQNKRGDRSGYGSPSENARAESEIHEFLAKERTVLADVIVNKG